MLKQSPLNKLDDFFSTLSKRSNRGVYFYRVATYNAQIRQFIRKYYEAARVSGVIIEGRIPNPTPQNLSYYTEIMGTSFQLDNNFINKALQKWLPRLQPAQRDTMAKSIFSTLSGLRAAGKNDNMLKNAYTKFMCWLYYKFERIANQLGNENLPKILYEGNVSNYELLLLSVLSQAGCDIVLLEYKGDAEYLKVDPSSERSLLLHVEASEPFPETFSLKKIQEERAFGPTSSYSFCTNAWLSGKILEDIRKQVPERGNDPGFLYNCFVQVDGAEDRLMYQSDLLNLQKDLKQQNRNLVIISGEIPTPTVAEINEIQRRNYKSNGQMLTDLINNFRFVNNKELHSLMVWAFVELFQSDDDTNVNRQVGKAVTIICWMKRYYNKLLFGWNEKTTSTFICFGFPKSENEALFCRFLSMLPVDVIIFRPNLNDIYKIDDKNLFEIHNAESLDITKYPEDNGSLKVGTSAYHAEKDLNTLLYQDSGLYRNQQYAKANILLLQTMYEEIALLWDEPLNMRQNFATNGEVVTLPVILAKVCGTKNGYWDDVRKLITEDTVVIKSFPHISSTGHNPIKAHATEFWKQGRLQRKKIKQHKAYQYGYLRDSIQDHILDKLQMLIEQRTIKGTFENGTEYTIISTVLNLDKEILRLIQKFDFTKKNPKLVYIITGETVLSLEDTIEAAFLNLIGFDIVFFVPTGYQCIEKYFTKNIVAEHQIGEYKYDLTIPDLNAGPAKVSWKDKIFKRGG